MADICERQGVEITPPLYPEPGCDCNLIAGSNITIEETSEGTVISAVGSGVGYTAGEGIDITGTVISNTAPGIEYTAGSGITIENNVISATGESYTAGENIDISNGVISAPNVYSKTETDSLLDDKQDVLTAGDYITISPDGTISGNYTKQDIMNLLGFEEITINMTDAVANDVTITVLGVRNDG